MTKCTPLPGDRDASQLSCPWEPFSQPARPSNQVPFADRSSPSQIAGSRAECRAPALEALHARTEEHEPAASSDGAAGPGEFRVAVTIYRGDTTLGPRPQSLPL